MSNRPELCATLLCALAERAPALSPQELDQALAAWELVDVGGAVVMVKGAEMHVGAAPRARGRWFGRHVVAVMAAVLREHGRIETVVMKEHAPGHAFAQRLGFKQIGEDGAAIRYELRKLRHAKPSRTA